VASWTQPIAFRVEQEHANGGEVSPWEMSQPQQQVLMVDQAQGKGPC
jgi:hypothetical protein